MNNESRTSDAQIEQLARRRAGAKLGWSIHASVYIAVNLLLLTLSALSGRHWAVLPAFGWGLGVLVHGLVIFVIGGSGGLHGRLVQRERNRLSLQRDPW